MRSVKLALVAALGLLVAACIPEFANPLTGGDPADPAVLGTWKAAPEGETEEMLLDITKTGDGISVVMRDPAGQGDSMTLKGTTAEVGGTRYASLTPVEEAGAVNAGFMVFRYELKDGTIRVQALDNAKIVAAVQQGLIKGTTTGADSEVSVKISASAEEVAAFLATPAGQDAFRNGVGDILVLKKAAP
jgi:hypothetical protein